MTDTITIRVRAFAGLREALGTAVLTVTLPAGADVAGLLAQLAAQWPNAKLGDRRFTVAVNRAYAPPTRVLADGDEVALIPPVSGGSGHGVSGRGYPAPTRSPISPSRWTMWPAGSCA